MLLYSLIIFSDNKSDHYDLFFTTEYNTEKKKEKTEKPMPCVLIHK